MRRIHGEITEEDYARLANNGVRVFAFLSDGEWHGSTEFCVPGIGGSAGTVRARMLRKLGITVDVRRDPEGSGVWQYRMDLTTVGDELAAGILNGSIRVPSKKRQQDLPVSTVPGDTEILDWLGSADGGKWGAVIAAVDNGATIREACRSLMKSKPPTSPEPAPNPDPNPDPETEDQSAAGLGEPLKPLAPRLRGRAARRGRGNR